jgi:hypothetical protein
VRIGAAGTPDPSAALEVSTTQGLLLPRLTLAQRDALQASATAAETHAAATLDTLEARLRQLETAGGGQVRR